MDPFLGEIRLFSWEIIPGDWLPCDGRVLQINQYAALYTLLSNTYGGDGTTTFCLPDLRGRTPIGYSAFNSPAPDSKQQSGCDTKTLPFSVVPQHTHQARITTAAAQRSTPADGVPATSNKKIYHLKPITASVPLRAETIANSGSGRAINNIQPSIGIAFCIATVGNYPSRD
ncbi:MAG: phage tail protein [Plesiomonas sp.]